MYAMKIYVWISILFWHLSKLIFNFIFHKVYENVYIIFILNTQHTQVFNPCKNFEMVAIIGSVLLMGKQKIW